FPVPETAESLCPGLLHPPPLCHQLGLPHLQVEGQLPVHFVAHGGRNHLSPGRSRAPPVLTHLSLPPPLNVGAPVSGSKRCPPSGGSAGVQHLIHDPGVTRPHPCPVRELLPPDGRQRVE